MKFIVFYLQLINSREGLGMFFSSAFLIRRLRKYTATRCVDETLKFEKKIEVLGGACVIVVSLLISLQKSEKSVLTSEFIFIIINQWV